eukprot:215097-Pelagomonas_calceolata.AAC.3
MVTWRFPEVRSPSMQRLQEHKTTSLNMCAKVSILGMKKGKPSGECAYKKNAVLMCERSLSAAVSHRGQDV